MTSIGKHLTRVKGLQLAGWTSGSPPSSDWLTAKSLLGQESAQIVANYEQSFAKIIGQGSAISFASARMGFYAVLAARGVGPGDEVLLPAFTCVVMADAVLKRGATPRYYDISRDTLGTNLDSVMRNVGRNTRVVVAQHSFGFPADLNGLRGFCDDRGIVLIEDCATSLGSTRNGVRVGTFGHASLFSTDHTKPLSTHLGGIVYTEDAHLLQEVRALQLAALELPTPLQHKMWRRALRESRAQTPRKFSFLNTKDLVTSVALPRLSADTSFLTAEFPAARFKPQYSYPARLPAFLAAIGLRQIGRWSARVQRRQEFFAVLEGEYRRHRGDAGLPNVLTDSAVLLTPLRFVWIDPLAEKFRAIYFRHLETEGTWFTEPLQGAGGQGQIFGYRSGSCSIAEETHKMIVNLPLPETEKEQEMIFGLLRSWLTRQYDET